MLTELTIQNFAIIDKVHLQLEPGFNVLTGETGAGKSIIIDAVGLLLGGRGEADLVRSGDDRAIVEGVFALDGETQGLVNPILEQEGLEGDDPSILVLAREIRREGRNVCRVNGRAVALKILESVGQHLVDIHGQTEHLSLMRVREHVDLLDRYAGLWPLRDRFAELVRALRAVRSELAQLRRDERELARRTDLLNFQVEEIESARLEPGEEEELAQERTRLANAERLKELADEAYQVLYESGDDASRGREGAAVDLVQAAAHALSGLARLDPSIAPLREVAETVSYQLEDLAGSLRDYRDEIEFNPRRLNLVEERLVLIHGLQRKYGDTIDQVLAFADRAREELDAIEHSEERIERLEGEEEALLQQIGRLGTELSAQRRTAGERMAAGIEAELAELSMAHARFGIDFAWRDAEDGAYVEGLSGEAPRRVTFDLTGLDRVEFLVAPNVGEPLKPLVRVASGGETSRFMLALKTVLAQADHTPTLIFDEIDAGIGGRIGSVVGQKLWGLTAGDGAEALEADPSQPVDTSHRHQVICVTHLPQLAGYGDLHLRVSKGIDGSRTVTRVECLEGQQREQELAGMLGIMTDKTRASAREILATSQERKRKAQRRQGPPQG